MALVDCPECNKSIASDAKACPNCGHPMEREANKVPAPEARNYGWGTLIYVIILIAGIFMLFEGRLTGLFLIIIGIFLIIGRYKLWKKTGKKIK